VFYCCEFADQFTARIPLTLLLFFSGECLVKRRRRERAPFTLFKLCWRNCGYVVEGRLDIATKMALASEWGRRGRRTSNTSQAEKEDEWVWIQDVQEINPEIVVHKASHPQTTYHDREFSPLVSTGHTLYVPPSSS